MTTDWLLLLLLIVSSQSVASQSTTDVETCGEGGLLRGILDNQQQILQILQQHQAILNRLGKSSFPPGSVLNVVVTFQVSSLLLDADSTTCLILGKIFHLHLLHRFMTFLLSTSDSEQYAMSRAYGNVAVHEKTSPGGNKSLREN